MPDRPPSPTLVEGVLWIVTKPVGFVQYDFSFEDQFQCTHPYQIDREITAIARLGSAPDYPARYAEMAEWGIRLIHTPEQYQRSSLLPHWYPLIKELTPRSRWYDILPTAEAILSEFELPVFIKGERQTNKHSRSQSIIETQDELNRLLDEWSSETILWWQRLVCREFVPLCPVSTDHGSGIPKSYEFRTFWFHGQLMGAGRYWIAEQYSILPNELSEVEEIGKAITDKLNVPFLVIDFAKTSNGHWIVIECNDGQDSGYAGVNAREMWRKVISILRKENDEPRPKLFD